MSRTITVEDLDIIGSDYMSDNDLIKVANSSFARDKVSKAVINTNDKERQLYLARKSAMKSKDDRLDSLEKKVLNLEAQIEILRKLIQS